MANLAHLKRRILQWLILVCVAFPMQALGQKITVTGTVSETNGEPVIGATVMEKGTANGTATDIDGKYTISVDPKATLVVSYVGYDTQEIKVNGQTAIDITIKENDQLLDEVVVVGYGTMKKSDMTGAISSVSGKDLAKRATTNPAEALQGKIAGVNIQKSGGNAGAGVSVKIRGVKTFGDNEPLYIIDGFPGDINAVNPQDIQSLEVLKDGAAAAIYGSVAANGVVLITTKSGARGDVKVDFNAYVSWTEIANRLEMLDADEYKSVHTQMYNNWNSHVMNHPEIYDPDGTGSFENSLLTLPEYLSHNTGVDTDWQKAMTRTGFSQNYMVSVRGGSDFGRYSVSYNHADDKGIFLGNKHRQDIARIKVNASKYIFDFEANMAFKYTKTEQPQYQLKEMYGISPLVPVYDESNEYGFGLTDFDGLPNNRNVMADNYYRQSDSRYYHTTANAAITVNFTPWLNFKTSYAYRGEHERDSYHTPAYVADVRARTEYPYNEETSAYWEEQINENVLSFNKTFGLHSVQAVAGTSIMARKYNWHTVGVDGKTTVYKVEDGQLVINETPAGFLDQSFTTIGAGAGGTFSGSGSKWNYRRVSYFGRVNYNFDDRYLLQATIRRDGSSKFGSESRWGTFPSVALGWRISNEEFFPKDNFVSNLKLRASWGRLGNENALGYYDFLALISTYNTKYQGYVQGNGDNAWAGSIARALENRSLKWETTDTKNIGVDYGFLNNHINGSINWYYNKTEDLLITKVLPPSAGLSNPILNVGKMRNTGVEFEINYQDSRAGWDYNIGLNLATTSNKVLELSDPDQVLYGEGLKFGTEHFPTQTMVGHPIGSFFLYKTDGLFQSDEEARAYVNDRGERLQPLADAGDVKFVDVNGDGVIDDLDKVECGSGIPKLEVNLNFSVAWRGFDLSGVLGSAWGHKLYNGNRYFYESMNAGSNFLKSSLDAWTPQNTNTDVPRAIFQDPNGNLKESDRFLENGNFVRLRQIQLGYTIPARLTKKIYIENVRFYFAADNLFTITKYKGVDPEFSRANVLNTGIDKLIYPFTRTFTVGAQVTF